MHIGRAFLPFGTGIGGGTMTKFRVSFGFSAVGKFFLSNSTRTRTPSPFFFVMDRPRVALTPGVRQLQALAQKIHTSEDAQEEAEVQLRVAALVSNPLPLPN